MDAICPNGRFYTETAHVLTILKVFVFQSLPVGSHVCAANPSKRGLYEASTRTRNVQSEVSSSQTEILENLETLEI